MARCSSEVVKRGIGPSLDIDGEVGGLTDHRATEMAKGMAGLNTARGCYMVGVRWLAAFVRMAAILPSSRRAPWASSEFPLLSLLQTGFVCETDFESSAL